MHLALYCRTAYHQVDELDPDDHAVKGDESGGSEDKGDDQHIQRPYSSDSRDICAACGIDAAKSLYGAQSKAVVQPVPEDTEEAPHGKVSDVENVQKGIHGSSMGVEELVDLRGEDLIAAGHAVAEQEGQSSRHTQSDHQKGGDHSPQPHPPVCEVERRQYKAQQIERGLCAKVLHALEQWQVVQLVGADEFGQLTDACAAHVLVGVEAQVRIAEYALGVGAGPLTKGTFRLVEAISAAAAKELAGVVLTAAVWADALLGLGLFRLRLSLLLRLPLEAVAVELSACTVPQ